MARNTQQVLPSDAQKVFSGILFDVYQWQQTLFDGTSATFEKIKRPDSAGVLAVTPEKKIIVTRQEQPSMTPFWSLLGGIVEKNEQPAQTAERELLEEAGLKGSITEWFHFRPATKIEWTIYLYIARDCVRVADQKLDAGEKIQLHECSFEEFIALTQQPDFRDTEVSVEVLKALAFPEKMRQLRQLLLGE